MRLLILSRCPPYPLHLGDRLIVYHLAQSLAERGHTIDLLAFNDRPDIPDERDQYAAFFNHIEIFPEPSRTRPHYFKRFVLPNARFPRHASGSWSPQMWHAIENRLKSTQYDAIQLFGAVQVYEFAHLFDGMRAIITPYESYALYMKRQAALNPTFSNRFQYRVARAFESFMFTPYKRTVVISNVDRAMLLAINPMLQVDVIPNGIDTDYFALPNTPREFAKLLFTGNYEYPPNVDAALILAQEILPRVQRTHPKASLWLVGNAPPPQIQALASERITVTGHVPDVRPYLAQATVFVSPLRTGAGIKNKILEALAMGCPVACTPLSADGIALTNGRDARIAGLAELPNAVSALLNDSALRGNMRTAGRSLIESRYTWRRVAESYERLYKQP
jgi:polysaccharide biosynthesis protein PslH